VANEIAESSLVYTERRVSMNKLPKLFAWCFAGGSSNDGDLMSDE